MKNRYFKVCELCGATLDPNEKCTCVKERKEAKEKAEIDKKVSATLKILSFGRKGKKK